MMIVQTECETIGRLTDGACFSGMVEPVDTTARLQPGGCQIVLNEAFGQGGESSAGGVRDGSAHSLRHRHQ